MYRAKQRELRGTGDAFDLRVREGKALPKALKNAQGFFKNTRQALGSWAVTKPWLNQTEVQDLDKQVRDLFALMFKCMKSKPEKRLIAEMHSHMERRQLSSVPSHQRVIAKASILQYLLLNSDGMSFNGYSPSARRGGRLAT